MTPLEDFFVRFAGDDPILMGLLGGCVIAALNTLGALLVLVWRNPSERSLDAALGFAAGVMLSASFTSLIIPGIEHPAGGVVPVVVGIALGVAVLDRADQWVPHVHFVVTGGTRRNGEPVEDASIDGEPVGSEREDGRESMDGRETRPEREPFDDGRVASVLLFIVAITLHNMPEGLAVGVAFGGAAGDPTALGGAIALMLAIGIQNVPEGLAVAVAARNAGFGSMFYAAVAGVRAGVVEIPLAVFGAYAVGVATPVLPYAMGFAAGGMLFVISDEIVPETHVRGNERAATLGLMVGVVVMLYLDVTLG